MELKKYLPLGSVVELKEGNKDLMIVGRLQRMKSTGEVFYYAACLYPEGLLDSTHFYLFNHRDIHLVRFLGLLDEQEIEYEQILFEEEERLKKDRTTA